MPLSEVCMYCNERYVNFMNYCLSCGRHQSMLPKPRKKSRRGRRLTKEKREALLKDIQLNVESGTLNMYELGKKYAVDPKTVAYWRKKLESKKV